MGPKQNPVKGWGRGMGEGLGAPSPFPLPPSQPYAFTDSGRRGRRRRPREPPRRPPPRPSASVPAGSAREVRSEEHTSELQSRPHLVCRLLLYKKIPTALS